MCFTFNQLKLCSVLNDYFATCRKLDFLDLTLSILEDDTVDAENPFLVSIPNVDMVFSFLG